MTVNRIDWETVLRNLRRIGIPATPELMRNDLEYCKVCEKSQSREPSYYRRFGICGDGVMAVYKWRPLNLISTRIMLGPETNDPGTMKNSFIGMIYIDGAIRQDVFQVLQEIYIDGLGAREWPAQVVFWKDHVPLPKRSGLAAYRGPHDNRVIVGP
jgi:hypothetical protein